MGLFRKLRNGNSGTQAAHQPEPESMSPTGSPTVRLVSDSSRRPEDDQVDVSSMDGDDIAPALSMMSFDEPRSPVSNGDDQSLPSSPPQVDRHKISRSSLEKPLPNTPHQRYDNKLENTIGHSNGVMEQDASQNGHEALSRKDVARKLGVDGMLDLQDSEDTSYHQRQAPAVVHETVQPQVHEILHENYEREYHEHDIFHRILPVQDVEVLPARHYVEDKQGLIREVFGKDVPARSPAATDRMLADCFQRALPVGDGGAKGRRQFTARGFTGTDGDYSESVSSKGTLHTDRTWVHPPTLEQGAACEDAYHVHFD